MATKKDGSGLPAELEAAFSSDSGKGFEEITSSDLQIPFLRVLQPLSPQLKKSDDAFIEGASQGDIFNTVTKTFWSGEEGVVVIPCYYQLKLLEFVPRTQGGGFQGELSPNSPEVQNVQRDKETNMELLDNGNELVKTAQHYVKIVHEDGTLESAIIDMKKTQLKKSRGWNTLMSMQKHNGMLLPTYSNMYRLTTSEDSNDKGSWITWSVKHESMVKSIDVYNDAKGLHESVSSGELQMAPAPSDELLAGPVEAGTDEDIPF
jgi:hypothetical protein